MRGAGTPSPGSQSRFVTNETPAGLLHRGKRNSPFRFLLVVEHDQHVVLADFLDLSFEPAAVIRRQDARPTTHEPTPITWRPQWALPRRRDLQLIVLRNQTVPRHDRTTVEQRLDCARRDCAIVDGDRRPVPSVDPYFDQHPRLRPTSAELNQVVPSRIKPFRNNVLQLL